MDFTAGRVGETPASLGVPTPAAMDPLGHLATADLNGRYAEAIRNKRGFICDSDAVTILAAHATKGALGTIKFINGIYNPLSSGVVAYITRVCVATVSGTPGGPFLWNYLAGLALTNAQAGTIRNAYLDAAGASEGVILPEVNTVLSVGALTTNFNQLEAIGGPAAIGAGVGMYHVYEDINGRIAVPPGVALGICADAVGTTHVVQSSIAFVIQPLVAGA